MNKEQKFKAKHHATQHPRCNQNIKQRKRPKNNFTIINQDEQEYEWATTTTIKLKATKSFTQD